MPEGRHRKSYHAVLLKTAVLAASGWVIYRQVVIRHDLGETLDRYAARLQEPRSVALLALVLAMMAFNWLLEAQKWRYLVAPIQKISAARALAAVVSGITVSLFTPNRIGEYAGRVLHLARPGRLKAVVATVVGSMNQLLVTVAAGTVSLLAILAPQAVQDPVVAVTALVLAAGLAFMTLAYFNVSLAYGWLSRFRFLKKADPYLRVLLNYRRHELLRVSGWSVMRYAVFTLQFVLLLKLYGVETGGAGVTLRQIALSFLILSAVPTFAVTELGVRGSVALYCLEPLTGDSVGVLAASSTLYFINLLIPAAAGAFSLLFIRLFRKS
jgi:hypothetical protein